LNDEGTMSVSNKRLSLAEDMDDEAAACWFPEKFFALPLSFPAP
jgi:hypothetical protein